MLTEHGVVQGVQDQSAYVKVERSEACHSCHSQGACKMLSSKEMVVEAANDLGARVGDQVEIGLPTGSFLTMSLVVYFVPVVAFVGGAALGWSKAAVLGLNPTLASVLAGFGAMAVAFVAAKGFDRRAGSRTHYRPRIMRILPSSPAPEAADDSK
ncbi:positive regulator of sigma(E), RseC/MucC [Desulfacinum hydrothermale DSM 13146]|uniref:Positive regulator of sigma(E), RseC/MucC n=1 Tax=Desulfacinum hydrothermale DSM 13146 TaxID=1121390 RepID=A0A1W1XTZ8_9BACT|nr:SoxR reducing system RseC family protein [Desulfacinum hydrothermale]SMC27334.1 positive regulator of sigma(E), RseC/MucC [Desulfacinum hydrothermale DSM 13146]